MQEIKDHPNYQLFNLNTCGDYADSRVALGDKTAINEFPWYAALVLKIENVSKIICGGSLITERYVSFVNCRNISIAIIIIS